jgi:hypothetical protein
MHSSDVENLTLGEQVTNGVGNSLDNVITGNAVGSNWPAMMVTTR